MSAYAPYATIATWCTGFDRFGDCRMTAAGSTSDLLRVIAVAQTQIRGDVVLDLLSIECYAAGSIVQFRLSQIKDTQAFARFPLIVTDDRGTTYQRSYGGAGGGPEWWAGYSNRLGGRTYSRVSINLTPTLDPAARTLHLEMPHIERTGHEPEALQAAIAAMEDRGEFRSPPFVSLAAIPGPWVFIVPISSVVEDA
jgi:hypothetical protein